MKVPLEPHIYKFVLLEETFDNGVIDMKKRNFFPITRDWHQFKKHFAEKRPGTKEVLVLTIAPRKDYLYGMIRYWEDRFAEKMLDYIDAREDIMPALAALKQFLDKYDIDSEEYKLGTGYKRYQRHKLKQNEPRESEWR